MKTDDGRIFDASPEDAKRMEQELKEYQSRLNRLGGEIKSAVAQAMPKAVPITEEQEKYFRNRGLAFRALWAKRIANGLTPEQSAQLNSLIEQDKLKE